MFTREGSGSAGEAEVENPPSTWAACPGKRAKGLVSPKPWTEVADAREGSRNSIYNPIQGSDGWAMGTWGQRGWEGTGGRQDAQSPTLHCCLYLCSPFPSGLCVPICKQCRGLLLSKFAPLPEAMGGPRREFWLQSSLLEPQLP